MSNVQLACIWEATARKVGNVHRTADFGDLSYIDFLSSAAAVAPILTSATERSLGATILQAVQATRRVTTTNVNLGIILLLAPLCTVPDGQPLRPTLKLQLEQTTLDDSRLVYQAIRLAQPGGLGEVDEQDIHDEPTLPLLDVMELAADRDLIAAQYVNGFRDVFEDGVRLLEQGLAGYKNIESTIVYCQLGLLAKFPDSLIARKCGDATAEQVRQRAQALFAGDEEQRPGPREQIAAFDHWLRQDGHKRNPGTIADLVAASLFAALREDKITVPLEIPWSDSDPWQLRWTT